MDCPALTASGAEEVEFDGVESGVGPEGVQAAKASIPITKTLAIRQFGVASGDFAGDAGLSGNACRAAAKAACSVFRDAWQKTRLIRSAVVVKPFILRIKFGEDQN